MNEKTFEKYFDFTQDDWINLFNKTKSVEKIHYMTSTIIGSHLYYEILRDDRLTSQSFFKMVAKHDNWRIRYGISKNKNLKLDVIKILLEDEETFIEKQVISSELISDEDRVAWMLKHG